MMISFIYFVFFYLTLHNTSGEKLWKVLKYESQWATPSVFFSLQSVHEVNTELAITLAYILIW